MDKITEIYKKMLFEATDDDINRVQKANPEVDRSVIQTYADEADPKKGKGPEKWQLQLLELDFSHHFQY